MMKSISYFISERGNQCECCGADFTYDNPPERHHCLEKRDRRFPELDHEINIELIGKTCCHATGKADTQDHALSFAKKQIAMGYDVLSWWDNLPLKTRRFNLRGLLE